MDSPLYLPHIEPERAKLPENLVWRRIRAKGKREIGSTPLDRHGVHRRLAEKLRLSVDVQDDVGRADAVVDPVDLVARLAVVVALVAVGDVVDGEQLLALVVQLHRAGRPGQRVRVEPLDLRLWVAVEETLELRLRAHQHRLGGRGVEHDGRVEHVEPDVDRGRQAALVLGVALEYILVLLAADALELEQRAGPHR